MSQRRFANSGYPVDPVNIARIRLIGRPGDDLIQQSLPGAFHTTECQVITRLDAFEPRKQKFLLYASH